MGEINLSVLSRLSSLVLVPRKGQPLGVRIVSLAYFTALGYLFKSV
jgi:hypothetical protein